MNGHDVYGAAGVPGMRDDRLQKVEASLALAGAQLLEAAQHLRKVAAGDTATTLDKLMTTMRGALN